MNNSVEDSDVQALAWLLGARSIELDAALPAKFSELQGGVQGLKARGVDRLHGNRPVCVLAFKGKVNVAVMRSAFPLDGPAGSENVRHDVVLVLEDDPSIHIKQHLSGLRNNVLMWKEVRIARAQLGNVSVVTQPGASAWCKEHGSPRLLHNDPMCRLLGLVGGDVVRIRSKRDGTGVVKLVI